MAKRVGIRGIQRLVARCNGLQGEILCHRTRRQPVARIRQTAMWLSRRMTGASLPRIAYLFHRSDHTTVLHALRCVEHRRATDPAFADELRLLELILSGPSETGERHG